MDMQPMAPRKRSSVTKFWAQPAPVSDDFHLRMAQSRALLKQGETVRAKAIADDLHALAPMNSKLLHLRADCAVGIGDDIGAITLFERALHQADHADLWAGKANAFQRLRHFQQAAACFSRASALDRTRSDYLTGAAECLLKSGAPKDALRALKKAGSNTQNCALMARILSEIGDAKSAFPFAVAAAPNDRSGVALRLARRICKTGNDKIMLRKECTMIFEDAQSSAHQMAASVAQHRPYLAKSTLDRIKALAAHKKTPADQGAIFHHMLFRHYDYIEERGISQQHLVEFHRLQNQTRPYRRSSDNALFTILKRLRFSPLPRSKSTVLPIFVCGLPGSGHDIVSRLLETAAAPSIARPLHLVDAVMTRFMRRLRNAGTRDVSREELMGLQSELRTGLQQAAQNSEVVVDTSRLNFRWSGLLVAALPEARVVHTKSDKMQMGWAMYARDLHDESFGCQHELPNLAAYLSQTRRLMNHWEQKFDHAIHGVSSASLTGTDEKAARSMVEACQLKWSGNCSAARSQYDPDWHRYADLLAPLSNTSDMKGANTLM